MALDFKVYRDGELVAACRYAEEAAGIIAVSNSGVIKVNGRIVWREGEEDQAAWESYDYVAEVIARRVRAHHENSLRILNAFS
jgi:hypothetical protein